MIFLLEQIRKTKSKWNERPLDEVDFFRICKRFKIRPTLMPLRVAGFHYCVGGVNYIAIDTRLEQTEKLFTMFHELAHAILHLPSMKTTANFRNVGERNEKEDEADLFAYCCLLPQTYLRSKTITELIDEDCFSEEFIRKRQEIFLNFGV